MSVRHQCEAGTTSQQSSEVDAAASDANTPLKSSLLSGTDGLVLVLAAAAVAFPSQNPPSHTSVRIAAPAAVLSGTPLGTVRSFYVTSTRNTLETRSQRRGQNELTADNKSSAPL